MKIFSTLIFILFISSISNAQLVSYQKIDSLTVTQLTTLSNNLGFGSFIIPEYDVDIYRVMHNTEYLNGETVISGLLVVPKNTVCKVPLIAYQHGTVANKWGVPSYNGGEKNIVILFASIGNVVCASDYIGLGASTEVLHPYMHAYSQAHSTINLIRSVKEMHEEKDFNISNQLFLFGYSQGGFATAAVAKYIETDYSEELTVTAAAPMSGPYNMAGVQYDMVNSGLPYSSPGYLPYVVLSYQSMYGNLYNDISEIFKSPYDSLMPYHYFGHNSGFGIINSICTPIPTDMFIDSVYADIQNNSNNPFRQALQDNDLLSWTPLTPMKLFYCKADDQVTYLNAEIADSVWNLAGAKAIESVDYGNFDHGGCFPFTMIGGKSYLESFYNDGVEILVDFNQQNNSYTVSVLDDDIANYDILWSNNETTETITGIDTASVYVVALTEKTKGCNNSKSFKLADIYTGINNLVQNSYFGISPNPAKNSIVIEGIETSKTIYIVNILGEIVLEQNINKNNLTIDVSALTKGIYLLGINGVKVKRKLIIE